MIVKKARAKKARIKRFAFLRVVRGWSVLSLKKQFSWVEA